MKGCTIAVIGHVDHGKTALVRALTGIETDRLKEERERGLSIALGFAWRDFPTGGIEFVDAPGHEDFIRTTVSGLTGVSAVLLVVSAVDGIERQTIEHLQIASLLGIHAGVVAVTKSDLLGDDALALACAEISQGLIEGPLDGAPMVCCSARTGAGLDALSDALACVVDRLAPPPALLGALLPVDRVFSVRGSGAVVTGTLLGAPLRLGDEASIQPSQRRVTVRGLQSRGSDCQAIEPGRRAAVNIRGASVEDIRPGDVLCTGAAFAPSRRIDTRVALLPSAARPLKSLDEVRVLLGTRGVTGSARILQGGAIQPGEAGLVQFRFAAPILAYAGQHGVLRRLSPADTIGGLVVLDPVASPSSRRDLARIEVLHALQGNDPSVVARAITRRDGGLVALRELERLLQIGQADLNGRLAPDFSLVEAGCLALRTTLDEAASVYLAALADAHRQAPARVAVPLADIRRPLARLFGSALVTDVERTLSENATIRNVAGKVALAGHDPLEALDEARRARMLYIEAILRAGGATPPDPTELAVPDMEDDLVDLLIDLGRVVRLRNHALRKNLLFHVAALREAYSTLAANFPGPSLFRTGEAREALATSRKFIVPLLEYFDAQGWTVREGDLRGLGGASETPGAPQEFPLHLPPSPILSG